MPELYQASGKPPRMAKEAVDILRNDRLPGMRKELEKVRKKLGAPGASRRAAQEVLKVIASGSERAPAFMEI